MIEDWDEELDTCSTCGAEEACQCCVSCKEPDSAGLCADCTEWCKTQAEIMFVGDP